MIPPEDLVVKIRAQVLASIVKWRAEVTKEEAIFLFEDVVRAAEVARLTLRAVPPDSSL